MTHPHDSVALHSICTFELRRLLQATNLFATPLIFIPALPLLFSATVPVCCLFVQQFRRFSRMSSVFPRFTKRESLLPYQPLPLCCLTTHSFSCRSSCIGAVHTSLDGSSLFAVSSSLMCASSQKRDAEILLSHRPSGSADFLEFLKGRVFHYVSSGQAVIWVYKHFSKLDNLNCCVLKCKACRSAQRSELLQNKLRSELFDSFCFGFMHLYRWWLCLFNVSAIDTCSTWLRMCGLHRFARAQCFPVKWNQASATAQSDTVDRGGSWINAPKLESGGPTLRLEQANVSPLTAVSWEAINDSHSHNPGSDPRITLIASAPWPASRSAAAVFVCCCCCWWWVSTLKNKAITLYVQLS